MTGMTGHDPGISGHVRPESLVTLLRNTQHREQHLRCTAKRPDRPSGLLASFGRSRGRAFPGSNESSATEISGGKLLMNIRNQRGDIRQRIIGLSEDGSASWKETYFDPQLPDPICQGSILTIAQNKKAFTLAFSNAADTKNRDNLTIRISKDDGRTWPISIPIDNGAAAGESPKDFTAYSDLVLVDSKNIGIVYERKDYSQIVFKKIKWK
jgi:sialidase-1